MKTLILVRHAKSSWDDDNLPDRFRPLAERGERDAPVMGARLAAQGVEADLILSSPATRALSTAEALAEEIEYPVEEIVTDERIYGADPSELLQIIRRLDPALGCVILVGHNPELTELVNDLSPVRVDSLPTCAVVTLEYRADRWDRVGDNHPSRMDLDFPRKKKG